jgi:hypothetical protein
MLIGDRELFTVDIGSERSEAGKVLYLDRHCTDPDGVWDSVTVLTLGFPVASELHTRRPMFDWKTCFMRPYNKGETEDQRYERLNRRAVTQRNARYHETA